MLTANRPEMARRAVECFRRQTYENKRLLIWDTGQTFHEPDHPVNEHYVAVPNIGRTIGELRNHAIAGTVLCNQEIDILIHWDDDDYSHPNRIAEQVALLQSSGADCVGYNEMLFWREPKRAMLNRDAVPGEAWLYSNPNPNYALGTSLCYWRRTWERKPFEATSAGEDLRFISGLNVAACQSFWPEAAPGTIAYGSDNLPRMIARIHSGNTSSAYDPRKMEAEARKRNGMWKRVPEWDSYCAEVMA